ncbi:MAG: hypothetical protein U9Q69_02230 [Nanoarchaeota archaeon]|nr:hypothetical protein [Nanoarchaeota archaeon]
MDKKQNPGNTGDSNPEMENSKQSQINVVNKRKIDKNGNPKMPKQVPRTNTPKQVPRTKQVPKEEAEQVSKPNALKQVPRTNTSEQVPRKKLGTSPRAEMRKCDEKFAAYQRQNDKLAYIMNGVLGQYCLGEKPIGADLRTSLLKKTREFYFQKVLKLKPDFLASHKIRGLIDPSVSIDDEMDELYEVLDNSFKRRVGLNERILESRLKDGKPVTFKDGASLAQAVQKQYMGSAEESLVGRLTEIMSTNNGREELKGMIKSRAKEVGMTIGDDQLYGRGLIEGYLTTLIAKQEKDYQ